MKKTKIVIGAAHVMLAILLIFLVVFLFTGLSTGWFAKNEEVSATGMSAKAAGPRIGDVKNVTIAVSRNGKPVPADTAADGSTIAPEDQLLPGDIITVTADFSTLGTKEDPEIPVEFFVRVPVNSQSAAEQKKIDVPVTLDANAAAAMHAEAGDYYLSSQIWVQSAKVQTVTGSTAKDLHRLMDNSKETNAGKRDWLSEHILARSTPLPKPADIALGRIMEKKHKNPVKGVYHLAAGSDYRIQLVMEFAVDPNGNQSPLRGNYVGKQPGEVIPSSFLREILIREDTN